ncbi:unnamed protein product [Notodromas monacha]|uniref:Uncharacterized protein n=1 Tax=Notodromas monacha TaxID=399045 RepID=A0A7R9GJ53_9CRUS|nr:unnamed protein product [Notodromas monacha]CAG0922507.1 unnamed protein product [Notodromas monacha]
MKAQDLEKDDVQVNETFRYSIQAKDVPKFENVLKLKRPCIWPQQECQEKRKGSILVIRQHFLQILANQVQVGFRKWIPVLRRNTIQLLKFKRNKERKEESPTPTCVKAILQVKIKKTVALTKLVKNKKYQLKSATDAINTQVKDTVAAGKLKSSKPMALGSNSKLPDNERPPLHKAFKEVDKPMNVKCVLLGSMEAMCGKTCGLFMQIDDLQDLMSRIRIYCQTMLSRVHVIKGSKKKNWKVPDGRGIFYNALVQAIFPADSSAALNTTPMVASTRGSEANEFISFCRDITFLPLNSKNEDNNWRDSVEVHKKMVVGRYMENCGLLDDKFTKFDAWHKDVYKQRANKWGNMSEEAIGRPVIIEIPTDMFGPPKIYDVSLPKLVPIPEFASDKRETNGNWYLHHGIKDALLGMSPGLVDHHRHSNSLCLAHGLNRFMFTNAFACALCPEMQAELSKIAIPIKKDMVDETYSMDATNVDRYEETVKIAAGKDFPQCGNLPRHKIYMYDEKSEENNVHSPLEPFMRNYYPKRYKEWLIKSLNKFPSNRPDLPTTKEEIYCETRGGDDEQKKLLNMLQKRIKILEDKLDDLLGVGKNTSCSVSNKYKELVMEEYNKRMKNQASSEEESNMLASEQEELEDSMEISDKTLQVVCILLFDDDIRCKEVVQEFKKNEKRKLELSGDDVVSMKNVFRRSDSR